MTFKNASFACLLAFLTAGPGLAAYTQAPPATPVQAPPAMPAARPPASVIAGIPVNYDEEKVGTYTLPDALKLDDGKAVRDAKTWTEKRRPEIVKLFETQQYGVAPGRPADESFEVVDKGTPAFNGKAIRRQVTIHLSKDASCRRSTWWFIFRRRRRSRRRCF